MRIRIDYTIDFGDLKPPKSRTLEHTVRNDKAAEVYAKRNCRSNETYVITIISNLSTPDEIQEFWSE